MTKQTHRAAHEIAEASRALDNDLGARFVKPTISNALIDSAKRLQRLQTRAAKLRRALKAALAEVRAERKNLKALSREIGRGL